MTIVKKIACLIVIAFLATIGAAGCYVASPPAGQLILCIYADDIIDLNLVINASDANANPFVDDSNGVPYVDYIAVARTAEREVPNECESQRPYHVVRLKAAPGETIHASIRVTGPTKRDLLTCVYYVNGVEMPSTRVDGRNSIVCQVTVRI